MKYRIRRTDEKGKDWYVCYADLTYYENEEVIFTTIPSKILHFSDLVSANNVLKCVPDSCQAIIEEVADA